MGTVCYARDNKLFSSFTDEVIKAPALLLDVESDTLVEWGTTEAIVKVQKTYNAAPMFTVTAVTLEKLSAEEQAYVINRMMNFTLSGFVKKFASEMQGDNAVAWLHSEMERMPA